MTCAPCDAIAGHIRYDYSYNIVLGYQRNFDVLDCMSEDADTLSLLLYESSAVYNLTSTKNDIFFLPQFQFHDNFAQCFTKATSVTF